MKRIIMRPSAAALALLCLSLLGGCLEDKHTRVAGGDDVPNDVEPLGKRAAEARDDSADWNGFKSMPRSAPGLYDTATVPDTMPDTAGAGHAQPKHAAAQPGSGAVSGGDASAARSGAALSKRADLLPIDSLPLGEPADTLATGVVDSAAGTVAVVHAQVKDSVRRVDSALLVPSDPARPGSTGSVLQVSGRVTYADSGIWETYLFRDADGDGSLAPRPGSANLADLELASKGENGLVSRLSQRLAAGPDLDFNGRADDRLLASLMTVTSGGDTVRSVRLLDADGDSAVIDFAKDSNLVDLIEIDRNQDDTGAAAVSISARLVVFSRDSARNYAVRYRRTEAGKDGGRLELEALGPRPDSSFRAGDDASWKIARIFPPASGLDTAWRAFAVRLSPRPGDFGSDRLLRVEAASHHRDQAYAYFEFAWSPGKPVPDGAWPADGEVSASLRYRNGTRTVFSGEADAGGMRGTVTDSTGTLYPVSFDRQGRLIGPR